MMFSKRCLGESIPPVPDSMYEDHVSEEMAVKSKENVMHKVKDGNQPEILH